MEHSATRTIVAQDEPYTCLTCSCCGNVKKKQELGSSKVYECKKCGKVLDRDVNASRNILIKYSCGL